MDEVELLARYALSVAIGLLIGVERERSATSKAGLRTFALIALAGTLAAQLAALAGLPWLVAPPLFAISAALIFAYNAPPSEEGDRGMTTVLAAVVCYLLGALMWHGASELAVALGLATTALLYFKTELHGFSRDLTRQDVVSFLQFAAITFVVLPVLPDAGYGPYGALNPYRIWLMVVLVSGMSLAGYVALRTVGGRHGPWLVGLLGGVASSTATTLAFARHARAQEQVTHVAAIVILLANLTVLLRIATVTMILLPSLVPHLAPILGGGLGFGLAYLVWYRQRHAERATEPAIAMRNPAEAGVALGFGLLFAVVLLASAWLNDVAGAFGVYGVAVASGLTDVDAITLSTLRLVDNAALAAREGCNAILAAYAANLVFKLGLARTVGGAHLARDVGPGFLAVGAGLLAGWGWGAV
jgi:uncharacterized membrane protein (DUF4010 family)